MRHRVLVLAVVIHRPDFLVSGAIGDEIDFGFGDAVKAAAKAQDDLVREAVCDLPRIFFCGRVVVLLAENLRALRILRVEEPTLAPSRVRR